MDIIKIEDVEEALYQCFRKALTGFAKTENNKDVYAIAFDCMVSAPDVSIRYANESDYEKSLADYDKYARYYEPYGLKGLFGYKYSVGDFNWIDWEKEGLVKLFLSSGYCQSSETVYFGDADRPVDTFEYKGEILRGDVKTELIHFDYSDGKRHNDGEFYIGLAPEMRDIFEEIIVNCIQRLKNDDLGLDKTEDFIMFMCDHDISNETFAQYVSRTVDKELFERLTDYPDLK